jgi:hypothetical protein
MRGAALCVGLFNSVGAGGARTRDQRIMSPRPVPARPGKTVSGIAQIACAEPVLAVIRAVAVRLEYGFISPPVAGVTPG